MFPHQNVFIDENTDDDNNNDSDDVDNIDGDGNDNDNGDFDSALSFLLRHFTNRGCTMADKISNSRHATWSVLVTVQKDSTPRV